MLTECFKILTVMNSFKIQAALVIRGGYVQQNYREYQNREYQVQ
jgi:hypothetical protein